MVQEVGKHPSQDTEDLPIRLCSTMRAKVLTEAVSGRDGKPLEISLFVSENMIDFTSWGVTMALQPYLVHRAFCFPVPVFWVSQDETNSVGFFFVCFAVYFLRNHNTLIICLGSNQLCFNCCTFCPCKTLSWSMCKISINNQSSKK